jgi:hypothetical protein
MLFFEVVGHKVKKLRGDVDDLIGSVTTATQLGEECPGENLGALLVGAHGASMLHPPRQWAIDQILS